MTWIPAPAAAGAAYETLVSFDFTGMTDEDYKAADGTKTWTDGSSSASVEVVNSGNMGATGEIEIDGSGGTGRGLVFSHNGDNPGTSATSGTAPLINLGFQQLSALLTPSWGIRFLCEYTLTGTSSARNGFVFDSDYTIRGNAVNEFNLFGPYIGNTATPMQCLNYSSGDLASPASEYARTTANRLFVGAVWPGGLPAATGYHLDTSMAGAAGSNFPDWKDMEMHAAWAPNTSGGGRRMFTPSTWGLSFLFGGTGASETIELNVKSLRIDAIARDV